MRQTAAARHNSPTSERTTSTFARTRTPPTRRQRSKKPNDNESAHRHHCPPPLLVGLPRSFCARHARHIRLVCLAYWLCDLDKSANHSGLSLACRRDRLDCDPLVGTLRQTAARIRIEASVGFTLPQPFDAHGLDIVTSSSLPIAGAAHTVLAVRCLVLYPDCLLSSASPCVFRPV